MSTYSLPGVVVNDRSSKEPVEVGNLFTGFRFENRDFVFNDSGTYSKISGTDKIRRDIKKLLTTDAMTNENATDSVVEGERYNPLYGTYLRDKQRFEGLSREDVLNTINSIINSALSYYVELQKNSENLDASEIIDYFDYVTVFDPYRPSLALCTINVKLASGETITLGTLEQEF